MSRPAKTKIRTIKVPLPEDAIALLGSSPEKAARELQILAYVELYRSGTISGGWAAEWLGMTLWEFIQLLRKHEVSYFDDTPGVLERQVPAAEAIWNRNPAPPFSSDTP
ncbi:MAG: hypothetical protein QOF51_3588 [Chloroflexota bacterium]|jgi:predicted HTH domain antitoxin|nr:hypothetical protein [Chloroflexota bacterium]